MTTLKEEREAIVDTIDDIMAKYHMGEHMYSPEREEVITALLSHEEKVVERVVEQIKQRPTFHRSSKGWKQALLYSLTLPITDEKV